MPSEEKNSPTLFRVLAFLFIVSVALNAFLIAKRSFVFPSKDTLIAERNAVNKRLNQTTAELAKFKGISQNIDKIVKDAQKQLEAKETQILKLQAEGRTTSRQNKLLMAEIDSLQNKYLTSIDSLLVEQQRSRVINNKLGMAQDRIDNLENQLGLSKQLIADNFTVEGIKLNKTGKKSPTAIAKRTNSIKICFDVIQNKVARSGDYELFMVITAPDGTVLKSVEGSGDHVFQHPEYASPAKFSAESTFNYKNQKVTICQNIMVDQDLVPGLYVAEIFTPTSKLGMTTLNLR